MKYHTLTQAAGDTVYIHSAEWLTFIAVCTARKLTLA